MSHEDGDWVREGTPRDADAEWNDEQSEYGTALSPVEWDDYSSEQAVPVARPRPQTEPASQSTADAPADAAPADGDPSADEAAPAAPLVEDPFVADAAVQPGTDEPGASGYVETTYDEPDAFAAPDASSQSPAEPDAVDAPETPQEPIVTPGVRLEDSVEDHPSDPVDLTSQVETPGTSVKDAPEPESEPEAEPAPVLEEPDAVHWESQDVDELTADEEEDLSDEYLGQAADEAAVADPDATRVSAAVVPEPAEETVVVEERTEVIDEPTDTTDDDDLDATQVVDLSSGGPGAAAVAASGAGAAAVAGGAIPDDVYRTGETAVIPDSGFPRAGWDDEAEAEERRLAEQLEAERRAREQRLGVVQTSEENAVRSDLGPARVTTDRFLPSFGLFVLRIITAFLLGLGGYNVLSNLDTVVEFLERQPLIPDPRLVTWILGFTLGGLALLLVVGLLQRFVGFVLLALSVATLVLLRWGTFNPFANQELISGDRELLLAGVGLVLLCMGGGLWGIDGAFRRSRARARAEKTG